MVILIGEEFAAKALANHFALLSGFSGRADAALERYQIEARLYDNDRREHRAADHYMER